MWELDYKECRAQMNWYFWTVVLEKTLEGPWTARRSNQSILKEISPEYSLEGLMLNLKCKFTLFSSSKHSHNSAKSMIPKIKPSVQFSLSVMSDSLWPHESQHARPPCPSPSPGVHWDSCPSSQWCHPAISSSVVPFSSCPQSLPASGSFPMSQLLAWGVQSTAVSALASFLPKKSQGWSPSEWTGWISLQSKDSQESSPTPQFKSINTLVLSLLHSPTLTSIHDHWKNHSLD